MWLKILTTALIIFSIAMLFAYLWIVGPQPAPSAPRAEKIDFLRRWAVFIGLEALSLIGSIIGAYIIGRRARQEYREQTQRNMEALIESTLRDHAGKQGQNVESD